VVIRTVSPEEAGRLARFAERTFREAFEADNNPGDMHAYCETAFSPEVMRGLLTDASITTLVVAKDDGAFAAYAQLRPDGPDHGPTLEQPFELWRFYVDKEHHGRGIAHQLMEAAIAAAAARGAATLWLGVWERNTRAQAFYRKFEFADIGSHTFVLGTDVQTDRLMARSIRRAVSRV
jgi:ribosomal protein S18 acetylase RimI-like enzyme